LRGKGTEKETRNRKTKNTGERGGTSNGVCRRGRVKKELHLVVTPQNWIHHIIKGAAKVRDQESIGGGKGQRISIKKS